MFCGNWRVEWLHDSEEAYRDNFDSSIEPWNLGVGDEDLLETHEADGVFTARTAMADPDKVDAMLSRYTNVPEWYEYGMGMKLVYDYTFDAETGDLLKAVGALVDPEGKTFVMDTDEYTYDVVAFDPAAGDSPFADFYADPDDMVDVTLHFVDNGTEMNYRVPRLTPMIVVHGNDYGECFVDEACTQLYQAGKRPDALTLYVK